LVGEEPGRFSSSVPSLVLQGLSDTVVSPASVECIVDRLRQWGTPVEACAYPGADHLNILPIAMPQVFRWLSDRRDGMTPDVCPKPLTVACDSP
jgi:acetyl esterase/lipase